MDGGQLGDSGDELSRLIQIRAAQVAKDSEVLATAPYVADALERLAAAVDDLQAARWAALAADQVAATVRGLARQQARLDAALLASVKAVDDRDDVVPGGRPRTAGARFLQHALGLDRKVAARHADTARLLDRDTGDLAAVGQAYAAGQISRGHVDLATGVHRRLRARIREALVPVVDPVTGEAREQRCIQVVDAVLARQAQALSVPETQRAATRVVEHLDPPSPEGAHERRYLYLSRLSDGSLVGRFACGPAQALAFQAVIEAGAAPQPGRAVDADGVEHDLRDERTIAQRRMDALSDALNASASDTTAGSRAAVGGDGGPDAAGDQPGDQPGARPAGEGDEFDLEPDESEAPQQPAREGEAQIRRCPGLRTGPYPSAEIILTATLDQLAAALALTRQAGGSGGSGGTDDVGPPGLWPNPSPPDPSGTDRPEDLQAAEGFAAAQHGGPVHPRTLALLACAAKLRTVLLDRHGGVLTLGRVHRLASPAQKRALLARDVGCVIPGCPVPGEHCDVHHVTPWAAGGATDLANLALLCPRHHAETDQDGTWEIHMICGVPWVRPPAWVHRDRPLLRNTTHRPPTGAASPAPPKRWNRRVPPTG